MVYKLCKERLQKTSVSDIYVTNYAGDIVNLLLNKPKIYRICYFPKNDIYVIGDYFGNSCHRVWLYRRKR